MSNTGLGHTGTNLSLPFVAKERQANCTLKLLVIVPNFSLVFVKFIGISFCLV